MTTSTTELDSGLRAELVAPDVAEMSDDAFLAAFEAATLAPAEFGHRAHVRAAWACVRADGAEAGAARFDAALRRYVVAAGAASKYDPTLTARWLRRIGAAVANAPDSAPFDVFVARHPELLVAKQTEEA